MDVKSTFLNGKLNEEVYVEQPPGFYDPKHPNYVYKLDKALYGLKQAPRAWYDTLSSFLISENFERGKIDNTLFFRKIKGHIILVQIYVDDIIFGSTNPSLCTRFAERMKKEYKMSMMGELTYFLGLQIKQSDKGTFINQGKYVKDMLKKFDLTQTSAMKTPMAPPLTLNKDPSGKPVNVTAYRKMIGSLLYLTASRPDIMYSTCLCARYQSEPKESHLIAVKRIFRYLKGTHNLGLWYPKDSGFDLTGYSDSDFAGCKLDRKSTTGGCQLLGGKLVSWTSKKQNSVSTSTAEAEYVAAGSSNNPVLHSKTKHIEIRYHFIRDHVMNGDIELHFIPTDFQLADIFTKPLDETRMSQSALVASKNVKFAITDSELPKNNHLARLDFDGVKYPHLVEAAQFLRQSCIAYAITVDPTPSKALLQQFWFTAEETSLTNKKGEQVPAISFSTQLGSGMMTALGLRKALRFPDKPRNGYDSLPTDTELIQFLDAMEYAWEPKPRTTIPNKKLTLVKKALMPSQLNYVFSHIIQCMSGKSGSLDQASKIQVQMAYSVIAGKNFDYATAIFDDLKSKIEKTERDPKIPYVRFICAYLKFLYPTTYPTNSDASFPKVGQRSLEVKTLPNEVSISQLRSRLSLLTSSSSAATQEVLSSAIPAVTPSKRPSTGSLGPSKKAKMTKEKATSSSIPKDVSLQTSLDAFVGLSSTSSAPTTSTVPAISVAVTTTVTQPVVTTPIPTSSIPISSPPISLVSNPPSIPTPQFGPIGPEHHSFEESLQFYKMFDNSGPSLATVDTNVNSLSSKVDSLSASLNNTTSAVQTAGDALKTLTATCASKADLSHITTLQAAIVKVREESKQQYDDLSAKIDACTATLQQVLDKLNAPALVPAPSFTEDDRSTLTIAVEFIHLATSDIPALEGRLTGLEAEVQKLATATTSSPSKDLSLVDNDKEGEKTAEENTDAEVCAEPLKETPSQVEGEIAADKAPPTIAEIVDDEEEDEDDDEDLDLEDQVDDSHQDDDDDDEEDQSLWCSSAATSSAIASKEVIQAGGRQGSSSGTPSQRKGVSAEETLKMISLPEENPYQFSPLLKGSELQIIPAPIAEDIIPISIAEIDEEEEDSLFHPGRPSRPSQWSEKVMKKRVEMIAQLESQRLKIPFQTSFSELDFLTEAEREESAKAEKLIAECRRDAQLALKIQSFQVKDKKLKRKPVEVQAALLKEIEEGRSKEQEINDKSIEWCKQKMDYRSDLLPITAVTISGRKKKDQLSVTMEITREDGTQKAIGYVEGLLKALINRFTSILNLPSPITPNPKKLKRRIGSSSSEDVAIIRNETSIKFSRDALFGPPPDLSVLDLSLPPGGPFQAGQVIDNPYGIFFRDDDEELRFQRVSEIPICPLNHLKDLLCLWCDFFPAAEKIKEIISQESLERRQKGEEIPEYMINPPKSSYS
ncbi:hypothetical protein L6452_36023 [Arctium lappa]|uniref:Uncharacterized protein n=1 Tax=Arctium lappa TaxID=4217 RepID=A0ACB8Y960_ARCLA|nr:hypothetical protein L6452_36023 [Arctium lappa]